jgi:branched-chain amino acid transport system ATP-binding protein
MTDLMLSIRNLSKSFDAVVACDDVSIDLMPNEIHALIGPNGAGKSTLIKQIAGELKQDTGQIFFNGTEVSNLSVVGRANAGLARSFQVSSIVMNFTARQNVMLAVQGNSGHSFEFFKPALKDTALIDPSVDYLDQVGMKHRLNVNASELSHGERRRLELAMALALEPKVFLLDEPMAGLGAEGSKSMTALLAELKYKAPILLVEHDMDAVFSLADRISVLVYGRIIASGSVDEIRSNADVKEAYLGSSDT